MSEKDASEMVDTIDRERSAFVRKYFNAEWPCRRLYHLMLNSDNGIEHVTNTILSTMESLERQGKMDPPGQNAKLEPVRQPGWLEESPDIEGRLWIRASRRLPNHPNLLLAC